MSQSKHYDIVIIGGGLAGLTNAIHLSKGGLSVVLVEKNEWPHHRVCGEYVSNEVLPYLQYLGVHPQELGATSISNMVLSSPDGRLTQSKLQLGGFGLSRFKLDHALMEEAKRAGCQIKIDTAESVQFQDNAFNIQLRGGDELTSTFVIGAHGKRSKIDKALHRSFVDARSPFIGIKYHMSGDFPTDVVGLHTFPGGYCGVSKVENDLINVCYLTNYDVFKTYKNIDDFEEAALFKNKHLKELLSSFTSAFDQPLTIAQISFSKKPLIENHILMSGDSAGMIHPLCGNGMGMAIHSAFLLSNTILSHYKGQLTSLAAVEKSYRQKWNSAFQHRLRVGHMLNRVVQNERLLTSGIYLAKLFPGLLRKIIKQTHGQPIDISTVVK